MTTSLVSIGCAIALTVAFASTGLQAAQTARGVVFHDRNGDGKRDPGEEGLKGIRVSNQREIVITDGSGRWELPCGDDTAFFVIKPRGWITPVTRDQIPQFYYIHKPAGSPKVKFGGVEPTGPLPESIEFPLRPQKEPDRFQAIFFGDPQPRDLREVEYISHDVVEELIGTQARFGVTLGDIVFDDLTVFEPLNRAVALIGIPWYNVIGNHDINYDVPNDRDSDETYTRIYGPNYYSFDHGPVHFIVLDDIAWEGAAPQGGGKYHAGLGPEQLEFVRNDLALVPPKQLVVLMMHIPMTEIAERADLYRLIEHREYVMSISGHTHYQEHRFIGRGDGWLGKEPHHHLVCVTVCGSWWSGQKNEVGIPHTMMRDGAPNGYSIITFENNRATIDFKAARSPASHQMNIHAAEEILAATSRTNLVYVNVFGGSERSRVEMRVGSSAAWTPLARVLEEDPYFREVREREMPFVTANTNSPPWRALPKPINSSHLWKGTLPAGLPGGTHRIEVRTRDMHGRWFAADRVLRVK